MRVYIFILPLLLTACSNTKKLPAKTAEAANNTIIAHRGAWKKLQLPENSIASLKQAIVMGYAGSEFDVRITADDSLVINHDPDYAKQPIEKTTYAQLIKTPLANGETLPTLRQYLQAGLANNPLTKLICELKPCVYYKDKNKELAIRATQIVREMQAVQKVEYISFDYALLKMVKSQQPKARTHYLNGDKTPAQLKADGITGADYHFSVFRRNPEWIAAARKLGIVLNAWTVNETADMQWLLANDFNFITTNEPELLELQEKLSPRANGWQLTWSDEFDYTGLPDSAKWDYDTGGHGWGNNELQYYTRADTNNALVKNGQLHITALKKAFGGRDYTSARLVTRKKGDWLYGRVEVKAVLPAGKGVWPAIWMLPTDWAYGGWPNSGEIDIMEHVGYMPDSVFCTIHTGKFNHTIGTQKSTGIKAALPYNTWRIYAMEWNADSISFFINGQWVSTFSNTHKNTLEWPFDKRFHLLLNVAMGGDWGGKFGVDETILSTTMKVDYVRVFRKSNP